MKCIQDEVFLLAGWWLVSITLTQEKKLQKEDKGEEMDGKVVKSPQFGYVPATFLKKYEDGDQGFLSTTDLKEMLVGVVGHVGGCLDIYMNTASILLSGTLGLCHLLHLRRCRTHQSI